MTYGQYVSYKTQTRFPSYAEYINNKARGITTYQTYGPLQAMTNQYSTVYPRSPGYIPGMPTIERISIESGECSEPPETAENGTASTALIAAASQHIKGILNSLTKDGTIKETIGSLGKIIKQFYPLFGGAAQPAIGPNIENLLDSDLIAKVTRGVKSLSDTIPFIGAIVDFGVQVYRGEDVDAAAVKAIAHAGIGLAVDGIVAAIGISNPFVALGAAVVTYFGGKAFDKFFDSNKDVIKEAIWDTLSTGLPPPIFG